MFLHLSLSSYIFCFFVIFFTVIKSASNFSRGFHGHRNEKTSKIDQSIQSRKYIPQHIHSFRVWNEMSRLSALLQEPATTGESRTGTAATETILCSLREQMAEASSDEARGRRRGLKERLGFGLIGIGCCGVAISVADDEEDERRRPEERDPSPERESDPDPQPGMNLATALAAERQFRSGDSAAAAGRVSLMRLLEESERCGGGGEAEWCCVCMGRRKGAAFIPCGHTFCRVCSRELWLNRGSCPLCNRPILEILDIF